MNDENVYDPLELIPIEGMYLCPECQQEVEYLSTQQGKIPLSANSESFEGVGRYAMYVCENHVHHGIGVDEDPEDKCDSMVVLYDSGIVSVGGDLENRQGYLPDSFSVDQFR